MTSKTHTWTVLQQMRQSALLTEPLAQRAPYNEETGLVDIVFRDECVFSFPPKKVQGLCDASVSDLKKVEITPMGDRLHWDTLDV